MRSIIPPLASLLSASVTRKPSEPERERVGEVGREREPLREPPERSSAALKSYERETDFADGRLEVDLDCGGRSAFEMNGLETSTASFVFTYESTVLPFFFAFCLFGDEIESEFMPCESEGVSGVLLSFFARLLGVFGMLLIVVRSELAPSAACG